MYDLDSLALYALAELDFENEQIGEIKRECKAAQRTLEKALPLLQKLNEILTGYRPSRTGE